MRTAKTLLRSYTITGMAHGAPIAVGAIDGGCGNAAPFILDAGISSTYRIAQFWDLAAVMPEAAQAASRSEHRNWNWTRQVPPSGLLIDEDGRVLEAGPAAAVAEPDRAHKAANDARAPGRFDPGAVITRALQAAGLMK